MNYGFIGAGNMASAIINGMTVGTGRFKGENIFVYDVNVSLVEALREKCNINICVKTEDLIKNSDVVIVAVKPNVLPVVLPEIKNCFSHKKPLLISIAVGKTLEYLQSFLGSDTPIACVMPNINAKVGAATSGYCSNTFVNSIHKKAVEDMFSTIGSITEIHEAYFSIFGVVAGSSPAFAYLYIDVLARAAQKAGMSKKQALEFVAQTVMGSAKMILESNDHPWELIDQVCSPGGTTIEGICELEKNGFESTITKAFDAVLEKDRLIQEK